ncbi:MAG: mechanosensitive ion channel, partial [Planctomycetes bacterium]|nr:mechanosensitive ion channel [Planctomycetota bacterium]
MFLSSWLFVALSLSIASNAAVAQDASTPGDSAERADESADAAAAETLAEQRISVAKQREQLQARLETADKNTPSDTLAESLSWQVEMLEYLEFVYAQHEGALEEQKELVEERNQLQAELDLLHSAGPEETKPYSFLLFDELQDQLTAEQGRSEAVREEIRLAQALLGSVKEKRDDAETQRRRAQEVYEAAGNLPERSDLQTQWERARLRSRVMNEAVAVRKLELNVARQKLAVAQLRCQWLDEKVAAMSGDVVFSADDLSTCLAALANDEQEIRTEIRELQAELAEKEQRWLLAKSRSEQQSGQDVVAEEQLKAWTVEREVLLEGNSLLNQRLAMVTLAHYAWERRYRSMNSLLSANELRSELAELESLRQRHQQSRELVEIRVRELRLDLAALERRLRTEKQQDPEVAQWIGLQIQATHKLLGYLATNLVRSDAMEHLLQKTAASLGERAENKSTGERLLQLGPLLQACWTYEIAAVDDRPITVGKLILGAILLLCGYAISRMLSRVVGRRIFTRLGMTPGAAAAVQAVSFYVLLTVFGFLSLELSNVPLTIFTFLGGAVAIGVGFGSQNLVNNFMSGLILLAERPVRIGDLVDIDGVNGTIEYIGARSTRVKTGENLEILVPNSVLLENKVTNWTLSDTQIRIMVSVGVAYGSPTRTVSQLLRKAVADNADVLNSPEPTILFKEFGDNALNFEVHFWVKMRTVMQGEQIASDVRHTID